MTLSEQDLPLLITLVLLGPLIVCALGVVGLITPLWQSRWFSRALGWLGVLASLISLLGALALPLTLPGDAPAINRALGGGDFLLADALSIYFILVVNVITFVSSWNAMSFLHSAEPSNRWRSPSAFHLAAQMFHVTMILVPLMNNLVALWIAMQATTLVSTLLVGFEDTRTSREAAWKYLIITSTGIVFALLGTMFLTKAADSASLLVEASPPQSVMNWTFLMDHADQLQQCFFRNDAGQLQQCLCQDRADQIERKPLVLVPLAFLFVLVGYGTKAGLAPMHTWLPDGHGEAPAPISALLSGVLLKSALYAILRFYTITNAVLGNNSFTSAILLGAAMLSLLIATPFILKANRFKRVLAYHSLEHMGIITFGLGIGGSVAIFGALLHVLNHAVTKALMFMAFGNIVRSYAGAAPPLAPTEQPTGVLRRMPITGTLLTLGGLALVGMPPFNIFMSELIMLWGALERLWNFKSQDYNLAPFGFYLVAVIVLLLTTTMIFAGLIRHLAGIVLQPQPDQPRLKESLSDLFPLGVLMAAVVSFGVWIAPPLAHLLAQSVAIVCGDNCR